MYHKTMSINSENYIVVDYIKMELQVAIWRDSARKRLVIAFRGTEQVGYIYIYIFALWRLVPYLLVQKLYTLILQVRWKDLRTDLMLAPAGYFLFTY